MFSSIVFPSNPALRNRSHQTLLFTITSTWMYCLSVKACPLLNPYLRDLSYQGGGSKVWFCSGWGCRDPRHQSSKWHLVLLQWHCMPPQRISPYGNCTLVSKEVSHRRATLETQRRHPQLQFQWRVTQSRLPFSSVVQQNSRQQVYRILEEKQLDLILELLSHKREGTFVLLYKPSVSLWVRHCCGLISGDEPNGTPCGDLCKCAMNKDY